MPILPTVEPFYHYLSTTVRQTVHRSQYNTETMEQRYTDTEFVVGSELHVLTRQKAVVGNVIMRQHHSLRETGGTEVYCILTVS